MEDAERMTLGTPKLKTLSHCLFQSERTLVQLSKQAYSSTHMIYSVYMSIVYCIIII